MLFSCAMRIETDRLILREYVPEDWRAVAAAHRKPGFNRFYPPKEWTAAEARDFVGWFVGWQKETPRRFYQVAICLQEDESTVIGSAGLRVRRLVDFGEPEAPYEADIGYSLDPDLWRRGYATEAMAAMLDFGFDELKLHRVWCYLLSENDPSAGVVERLGFRREAHIRENHWMQERWWDTYLYGLLASEWAAGREAVYARLRRDGS